MRRLVLVVAFSLAPALDAQPAQPATGPALTTRGAFFALSVPDLDASAKWYAEKLGLTVVMRPPKQDKSSVAVLEGGGLIVELLERDDALPLTQAAPALTASAQVHGFFKAGVIVDDFEKTLATLKARGVDIAFGPFPASATQRANVIVRDNAGNLIQFFGRKSGPRMDAGTAGMRADRVRPEAVDENPGRLGEEPRAAGAR